MVRDIDRHTNGHVTHADACQAGGGKTHEHLSRAVMRRLVAASQFRIQILEDRTDRIAAMPRRAPRVRAVRLLAYEFGTIGQMFSHGTITPRSRLISRNVRSISALLPV
jgi:hypothetical protein